MIHEERSAKIMFTCGGIVIAVFSLILAIFTTLCVIIGSNAELFVCRPLYDAPDYHGNCFSIRFLIEQSTKSMVSLQLLVNC